jgi:outer membrane lipoprotein-sorting protein
MLVVKEWFWYKVLMKIFTLFTVICLLTLESFASGELTKILSKYTGAKNVEVKVKKTDEKTTIGTKSVSEGVLKFSKNKIFISLVGEKKIELFYNNNTIWLVEYPDLDFDKDGHRKVAILKKSTPVLMTGLINLFSSQKKFLKEFKVIKEKIDGDLLTVDFKPDQKSLKTFTLVINLKERTINQVIFTDDVDTKTTLELDKLKLNKKLNAADFQFKKQKSDEVTIE